MTAAATERGARRARAARVRPATASPLPECEPSGVEYVFEPHSRQMPPLRPYARDLWERRQFIVEMAKTQVRGNQSSTFAGQLWGLLDPLFQAGIYWFLFAVISGGSNSGTRQMSFLPVLVGGMFLFNYTRIALNDGGRSIVKSKGLMLNSTFPRALLPITALYVGVLEVVPSSAVYVIISLGMGRPPGIGITVLPLLLVIQTMMNLGLAMLVATLTVYVLDVQNLLGYITRILIFTTPVIYPLGMLAPGLRSVLVFNPLFALFAAYQQIFSGGVPSPSYIVQAALWAIAFLFVGARLFLTHERAFTLRI